MNLERLRWVAIWVLVARFLDLYWIVLPSVPDATPFSWKDLWVPFVAVSIGIFVWIRRSSRAALIPVRDPRLPAGLNFHL
jgi:hypothetical protein